MECKEGKSFDKENVASKKYYIYFFDIRMFIVVWFLLIFSHPLLLVLGVYASVKNVIIFIALMYSNYLSESNVLSVKDALDIDARNAFMFGGIGLVQYDENRNIVWTSDLFKELNINIVGVKLLEWQPHLAPLFEDEDIRVIDVKGRKFEAYNSQETKLIYLKDVTQLLSLQQDYQDQQVCMAYITIDNYEETLERVDEPKMALIQSRSSKLL